MPELPEVETIRRTLEPKVAGRTIVGVDILSPEFIVGAGPADFRRAIEGARVIGLGRRGKYLIVNLEQPGPFEARKSAELERKPLGDILIHLKMAGQLIHCAPGSDLGPTRAKHTHVVFRLDDSTELRYIDLRHFGRLYFAGGDPNDPVLRRALDTVAGLGPEPRDGGLEWDDFRARLSRRDARLKPLLLDQSFVAGLGNIYADECLYRAKIHPLRRASSLSVKEARALYDAMRQVIGEAIDRRGTSIRDYVDGEDRQGEFSQLLNAYGRTGEACPRCGTAIERLMIGGRSSHFCPKCQRRPRTRV